MTNKNLSLNTDKGNIKCVENESIMPFLLKPAAKDYLWGGNRLNDEFGKNIDVRPLAETWECSAHHDGSSIVCGGIFDGQTLSDVIKKRPWLLGSQNKAKGDLPILIKLIDAKKDLSVQVHPNDEYAKKNENGQLGKTEMWYVIDAEKDAHLVYGLRRSITKDALRKSIENGTLEKYLQKIKIHKNDLFYIEAGTIHAIGAGALIAEIQENSNITYRLYDYDRVDKNGNRRPLHIDKALDCADLSAKSAPVQPMRVLKYRRGCASELLCRCKYFEVYRMLVNTESCRELVGYQADASSFRVLLCINGCGSMTGEKGESINFFKGDCIFFPANSYKVRIHGKAQFLDVRG